MKSNCDPESSRRATNFVSDVFVSKLKFGGCEVPPEDVVAVVRLSSSECFPKTEIHA